MNIFYLHEEPLVCAQMHNDKHCVKMILESAQMLCTAHRALDGNDKCDNLFMYKQAHLNHPSTKWVRENVYNYKWMFNLFEELCEEYTYRYEKVHTTDLKLREVLREPSTRLNSSHGYISYAVFCLKKKTKKKKKNIICVDLV